MIYEHRMTEGFEQAILGKRRTKISYGKRKSRECTKALSELTNNCKKRQAKRYLIDQSVVKAAIAFDNDIHSLQSSSVYTSWLNMLLTL